MILNYPLFWTLSILRSEKEKTCFTILWLYCGASTTYTTDACLGLAHGSMQHKGGIMAWEGHESYLSLAAFRITLGQDVFPLNSDVLHYNRSIQMMSVQYLVHNKCQFPFAFFELCAYFLSCFEDKEPVVDMDMLYRYIGMRPWDPFYLLFLHLPPCIPPQIPISPYPYVHVFNLQLFGLLNKTCA